MTKHIFTFGQSGEIVEIIIPATGISIAESAVSDIREVINDLNNEAQNIANAATIINGAATTIDNSASSLETATTNVSNAATIVTNAANNIIASTDTLTYRITTNANQTVTFQVNVFRNATWRSITGTYCSIVSITDSNYNPINLPANVNSGSTLYITIASATMPLISIIESKYKDLNDTLKLHESLNDKSFSKIEDELKEINEKLNKLLGYIEAKNNERKNH